MDIENCVKLYNSTQLSISLNSLIFSFLFMTAFESLNTKQVKQILALLEKQWGFAEKLDYQFFVSKKEALYIAQRSVGEFDFTKVRVNSIGMYFGEMKDNRLRLSIEGAQLIGPHAIKQVLELDDAQAVQWMNGQNIESAFFLTGAVIIKHGTDYLGSGQVKDGILFNYVPKVRRLNLDK